MKQYDIYIYKCMHILDICMYTEIIIVIIIIIWIPHPALHREKIGEAIMK